MGVLNVTPDSFSDGGKYQTAEDAAEEAVRMAQDGADIIDIGGESTRPGAVPVSAGEELSRVMPVIKALKGRVDVPISIDTWKSEVAREALSGGARIVNDVTALRGDKATSSVIARAGAGVILMHMRGEPGTMQDDVQYDDLIGEVFEYLAGSVDIAVKAGIEPGKIAVDPGIGFGKTVEHNLTILRQLGRLKDLGKPVVIGTSRKSFIGKLTGRQPDSREFGTAATVAAAILNGADIVRVHDVRDMRDVAVMTDAIKGAGLK